jgi:aspartyl-tRNA(Asn)/glutamyl-tRNA(Gln) amidotransferase subunit A
MSFEGLTIRRIHQGLKEKEFSALDVSKHYLEKIKKEDKKIFSFLSLDSKGALEQAKKIDKEIAAGKEPNPLAGVPCAIKDNILVQGLKCTAGSKILEDYIAPYDAFVIKKLKEQSAVILGKTNLDEFAMGASTENSAFGPTRNPNDLERVPGGSSGGSAASVAADFCCYSLGSDTGGSIRQPASFCGVVGLKPTYGSVSRNGLIAFASSLDQIGPITKNVEDANIVFKAISGRDEFDSTSSSSKKIRKVDVKGLKIGIPREYFVKGIDPEVEKTIRAAIKKYQDTGALIEEVSLPNTEYALSVYYIIAPSEASANLARYDGIKYGHSSQSSSKELLDVYLETRGRGFGPEVRRRIMLGTHALSSGYYDAYYLKAQKVRNLIKRDFEKVFEKVDVLMAPVSPVLPFKIGEKVEDPLSMYLVDVYTVSMNLAGLPALSLPAGKVKGLPVGLQIIGQPFEEDVILQTAQFFEEINK